jgi:hypothetical protein
LPTERNRVGLTGSQTIDESMFRTDGVVLSRHSVVLIDRHVCISLNSARPQTRQSRAAP